MTETKKGYSLLEHMRTTYPAFGGAALVGGLIIFMLQPLETDLTLSLIVSALAGLFLALIVSYAMVIVELEKEGDVDDNIKEKL